MKLRDKRNLSVEQIMNILRDHKDVLKKYKVKRIGLFGSYVRGDQKGRSDIDFLVEFDLTAFGENFQGYFDNFMDLVFFLEDLFSRKVDLITNRSLSPYIQPYVEKEVKWYGEV